jgi:XTP/dITP diphosphohydrolase
LVVRAEWHGHIAFAERGSGGFGYDSLFLVGEQTAAEMSPDVKNLVSHRGRALRGLARRLAGEGMNSAV